MNYYVVLLDVKFHTARIKFYHNLFSDLDLEHPDRSRFFDLKGYILTTVRGWRLATKIKYVFQNIIDRADELILDTPDIVNILGKFIARAYCEKILPQKFIEIGKARKTF